MARFTGGWIRIDRRIANEDIGRNAFRLSIWITLLLWATRQETTIDWKGRPRKIFPGTVVFGMSELADHLQISKKTVHKHLHYLQERHSILLEVGTRGSLVTICNWGEYQENHDGVVTPRERGGNAEVTQREHGATLNGQENKETKKQRNKTNVGIRTDYPQEFDELWVLYERHGDKKQSCPEWKKLTDEEKKLLLVAIANYKKANPDPKYRKHFQRFLKTDWRIYLELPKPEVQSVQVSIQDPWPPIRATLLRQFPSDGPRLDGALAQLKREGTYRNSIITHPESFIAKSWSRIRQDYEHHDKPKPKKEEPPEECSGDPEIAKQAIAEAMGKLLPFYVGNKAT